MKPKEYSMRLLFQFNVKVPGKNFKMYKCENRIVYLKAKSPGHAVDITHKYAKDSESSYKNCDGNTVLFQFIGIIDAERHFLDRAVNPKGVLEVWYDFYDMRTPMKRRKELTLSKRELIEMLT